MNWSLKQVLKHLNLHCGDLKLHFLLSILCMSCMTFLICRWPLQNVIILFCLQCSEANFLEENGIKLYLSIKIFDIILGGFASYRSRQTTWARALPCLALLLLKWFGAICMICQLVICNKNSMIHSYVLPHQYREKELHNKNKNNHEQNCSWQKSTSFTCFTFNLMKCSTV